MASEAQVPAIRLKPTGRLARRQAFSAISRYVLLVMTLTGVSVLAFLAVDTVSQGAGRLSWEFLTSYPSRFAEEYGFRSGILGTTYVVATTLLLTIPLGVGTAIWIEEYAPRNRFTSIVKLNIANLAGVPTIIYGILGLAVFVRFLEFGSTIIAAACTLSLMILPMVVITAQEAIRQVPPSIRDGSLALGATRWQTIRHHLLPGAMPGIITGLILATSRAAGETAALIMIGAAVFVAFDPSIGPSGLNDPFSLLPIQIYGNIIAPRNQGFEETAAGGIIVMMVGILTLNLTAAIIRERFRR
ncbi:MAG: phosphate ABC transporter permease PstA [Dehalococcoidia bacterium]|nr:phosphate ABC transporter permease PstA [Dehalococcoidia bacterium]